ncbi:hypothetical protein [Actinokineospora bangkokensis]|uniref:Uncharacterized protein n=1 Tax=Actinokineospora bangkokensis TaxID=1193682 RepID=A0A1Q9LPU1_9PSEU|nr:hypothetical protein [Actinokineospora bangkokensis]OLR94021.1 hypothetical protein BJP25_13675 [Actinokineospora bangkokensis]
MSEVQRRRPGRLRTAVAAVAVAAGAAAGTWAVVPAAEALPVETVPPIGADSGRFALPINCEITLPDFGGIKVLDLPTTVDIQGVAPTQLRPGQQFYLTEGKGGMVFPSWLPSLAGVVGITKVDANLVEMNIGAKGASPSKINISPAGGLLLRDIPLQFGKDLDVRVPVDGGTFPDIGPYTAPADGVVTLQFDSALVDITLKADWGLRLAVKAKCLPVAGNALLSMAVGGEPGGEPVAFHGVPMDQFQPVAANNQVGIINSPYKCTVLGAPFDVGIAVGANTPLSVKNGGSITFTNASGALVVPKATVDQLIAAGFRKVSGKVNALNLQATGGSPKQLNVLGQGFPIPETALVAGKDIIVPLPPSGTLTAGPWKPDLLSSHVKISLGTADADLVFDGGQPTKASCAVPSPEVILLDAPVTN